MHDIGPDYKTKWIGRGFPKWRHFALEKAGVPASAFMANKKSQQAKACSSGDGPPPDAEALEYHTVSTIGLLMCHLYWLTTQQDECTVASAFTSLECFLQRGLCGASCFCFVEPATAVKDLEECWPLSHGPVALAVEGPMVRIDGLEAIPRVWEELERADDLPITRELGGAAAASSDGNPPVASLWTPMVHLLCCLQCSARGTCHLVLAQILRFVAYAVESSTWVATADTNPLRVSVTQANKRARVIGQHIKDAIARSSAEGSVARTSRRVVRVMGKFKIGSAKSIQEGSVRAYECIRAGRYFLACQRSMELPASGPFLSVAQDGTRMGQLDMLYACLYSVSKNVGCWLPPIASPLVDF